jgi:hypothetical protein
MRMMSFASPIPSSYSSIFFGVRECPSKLNTLLEVACQMEEFVRGDLSLPIRVTNVTGMLRLLACLGLAMGDPLFLG